MFLDAPASDDPQTATTGPTDAARTRRADATCGAPTAAASARVSSRSGANKRLNFFYVSFDFVTQKKFEFNKWPLRSHFILFEF